MNILKKFKRIEQSVKSNVTINDGIDGLPFQDDDSWVNDGIDGLPFQDDDSWVNDGIDGLPFQDDDSWVDDGIDGLSFSSSTECLTSKPNQKIKKMGEKLWGIFRA